MPKAFLGTTFPEPDRNLRSRERKQTIVPTILPFERYLTESMTHGRVRDRRELLPAGKTAYMTW